MGWKSRRGERREETRSVDGAMMIRESAGMRKKERFRGTTSQGATNASCREPSSYRRVRPSRSYRERGSIKSTQCTHPDSEEAGAGERLVKEAAGLQAGSV